MNGVVFQTSTRITASRAVSGEAVQAIGWSIRPIAKQHVVDHAEHVVEHPGPHLGGDHGRDRPGNQDRGAQQAPAAKVRVERERDAEAKDRLHGHRDQGEHDRVPNRAPPVGILEQIVVVQEADELGAGEVGQVGVGQAEPDGPQQWPAGNEREHDQHRRHEQPGRAHPLPRQARRLFGDSPDRLLGGNGHGAHFASALVAPGISPSWLSWRALLCSAPVGQRRPAASAPASQAWLITNGRRATAGPACSPDLPDWRRHPSCRSAPRARR